MVVDDEVDGAVDGAVDASVGEEERIDGVAFVRVFLALPVFFTAPPLFRFVERSGSPFGAFGAVVVGSSIPIDGVALVIVFFFAFVVELPAVVHWGIVADLGRRSFISDFFPRVEGGLTLGEGGLGDVVVRFLLDGRWW